MPPQEQWSLLQNLTYLPLAGANGEIDVCNVQQVKLHLGQILRSKRLRYIIATLLLVVTSALIFYRPPRQFDFRHRAFSYDSEDPSPSPIDHAKADTNWSRFAYTQYVTNTAYLCNSIMIFETLHRLGGKADRLMMYPASMQLDSSASNPESQLLLKAQKDYNVKLMPVEVQHRDSGDPTWADSYTKLLAFNQTQYDRVLSLDSDSTVLQHMDELFLLPPSVVAMPRAYWLEKPYLSSQLVLIQPSVEEFKRVKNAIDHATSGDFDMEIVNNLYGKDCMILPHRPYDLLTGEFRSKGQHQTYLGNEYEHWDPEKILAEAKFLHFSDWPMPKPWLPVSNSIMIETQPKCDTDSEGHEDCRARDLWQGFYSDFKERRERVCALKPEKLIDRSVDLVGRSAWEFVPDIK